MKPDALLDGIRALRSDAMRDAVQRDGAISRPMAEWALDSTLARFDRDAVMALAERQDLAGMHVGVILASSVPTAPIRAVALPLLRGASRVTVRPSRRQREVAARVCQTFGCALVESVDVDTLVASAATYVVAYGGDEALETLAARTAGHASFEGHGHGFGVSVVRTGEDAANAVARDVAHYDQRGCLSPQTVFVEGDDPRPFARALADALERVGIELPRGPIDVGLGSAVAQWQGSTAARALSLHRGRDHAVATIGETQMVATPGARNIAVVPFADESTLRDALAPHARFLTCVGLAGKRFALPDGAAPRIVAAGTMQDPPLDGPEDPRPAITRR